MFDFVQFRRIRGFGLQGRAFLRVARGAECWADISLVQILNSTAPFKRIAAQLLALKRFYFQLSIYSIYPKTHRPEKNIQTLSRYSFRKKQLFLPSLPTISLPIIKATQVLPKYIDSTFDRHDTMYISLCNRLTQFYEL